MKMMSNCCSFAFSLAFVTLCAALLLGDRPHHRPLPLHYHCLHRTLCPFLPLRHRDSHRDPYRDPYSYRDRDRDRYSDSVAFDHPRRGCCHFISIFFFLFFRLYCFCFTFAFTDRGAVVVVLLVLVWVCRSLGLPCCGPGRRRRRPAQVLRTLRSVEASVHHLLATHNHGRERLLTTFDFFVYLFSQLNKNIQLRVEVVVVDDASTDNTAMKHNLKVGAARNLGVQASTGDVVFFCDSDDLYLENHVFTCFERLERESKAVSVTLGIEIDAENVDREWAIGIGQTLPMSTCMLRSFFDLIEGFPEGYYWAVHEDVAFLRLRRHAASLLGAQTINDITKLTSKYVRYPDNALDRQLEQFQKPMSEKKSDEEMRNAEPFMRVKELILSSHDKYIRIQKIPAALAGKPLNEWDNYWAVYQSLIRKEMRNNNSTYAEELRVAPLKSWRLSHLHTLATVLDQRGNGTYARLLRDLARTVTPTPLDSQDDTVNYHEISTSSA
ncbi:glycosyl transferase, putative [Acanthamoeba castellanii str. Neff]|uniref:Glycosyl transferase, putative n=1 Tax=Acanthamoeba castellanii (strain ATCC 30010 / Neff) TaxID=1257118 RepID=L8H8E3_ACACF|nr:glycosyl transferase, putative [Acanthamoeba castellanii str. Neff]ELR20731.1 glycosyl transferase, putative [Acanthamoeba castellanii str. Neff]